jgi:hypothetical protein
MEPNLYRLPLPPGKIRQTMEKSKPQQPFAAVLKNAPNLSIS